MGSIYVNPRTGAVRHKRRTRDRKPKWWTPERGLALAQVMETVGEKRRYAEAFDLVEDIATKWKDEERERVYDLWKLEQSQLHGERGTFGQEFDPVERDIFLNNRPAYYLVALGLDVMHGHRPVAQIRIPSTNIHLFVDVSPVWQKLGKWQRKKLRQSGQEAPVPDDMDAFLQKAARAWWMK